MTFPKDFFVLFRSAHYAFRGGFLIRPFAIAVTLGIAGLALSALEQQMPSIGVLVPDLLLPSRGDPQVAQAILSDIATAIMTVVAIVFAILLMTLTLASTQFSPRILISFVRDRVTQWTLGIFLGTFSYCIAVLPAAHSLPAPFEPVVAVAGAMLLATISAGWLIFFIHHISNAISVNHIVDRIRRETEIVIDELMPEPRQPLRPREGPAACPEPSFPIASRQTGYIRFIDINGLRSLARRHRICLRLERRVGQFTASGTAIMRASPRERLNDDLIRQLLAVINIGPARTMQQDVEFGIVQIVDIALRAMSPAVNDPTTAISCVDQLTSVMVTWLGRQPPAGAFYDPPHVLRVVVPWVSVDGLLDLAFEQIRHYAAADAAVSLRLMRAFSDIAGAIGDAAIRQRLFDRGTRLMAACQGRLHDEDLARLRRRFGVLEAHAGELSGDSGPGGR
jgi:uncharacterized membrane protein